MTKCCSVEGCGEPHRCKGYCKLHYERWRKTGEPGPVRDRPSPPGFKRCTGCSTEKPLDEFYRHPLGALGRDSRCRVCKRAYDRANAEAQTLRQRRRYASDPEHRSRRKATRDAWAAANMDSIVARSNAWREANPERYRAVARARRAKQRKEMAAYAREWRRKNREAARAAGRRGESARRARLLGQFVEHVDAETCFQLRDGICGICRVPIDPREGYHIDHIIPLSRGGEHSYANTQPAHARCNLKKNNKLEV